METTSVLASVVTENMMNGVLNEVVALLPICFPVLIVFAGIRKGISFVKDIIYSA